MTITCPACNSPASPLENCPRCGEFVPVTVTPKQATIPGLMPPLSAEIDSLRAQLSVARAQTASDRELIVELCGALRRIADGEEMKRQGRDEVFTHADVIVAYQELARAALGKVAP